MVGPRVSVSSAALRPSKGRANGPVTKLSATLHRDLVLSPPGSLSAEPRATQTMNALPWETISLLDLNGAESAT